MRTYHSVYSTKGVILLFALALFAAPCIVGKDHKKQAPETPKAPDIRSYAVTVPALTPGPNEKQVSLVLTDNLTPVANTEMILSYYDEASLSAVSKKMTTDDKGIASFIVPGRDDGASFIFRFGLNETDLNRTMVIRIASQKLYGGQNTMVIVLTKGIQVTNREGSMQLMRFPNKGEAVPNGGDILLKASLITLLRAAK